MSRRAALSSALDRIIQLTTITGGLAVVLMMVHIVWDVLQRYFLSSPLPGTISIVSHYYMVVATFLPLAYAEKLRAHIAVDIAYGYMSDSLKLVSNLLALAAGIFVMTVITWRSWQVAVDNYQIGSKVIQGGSTIVIWPGYFLVPFGTGLTLLLLLTKMLRLVTAPKAYLAEDNAHD